MPIFARRNNVIFMAYNLFAQQKQQNYPNAQTAQQVNPGQGNAGETPEQFAAGKQAANSQTAGYNAQPVQQTQQTAQPTVTPTAQPTATTTKPQATLTLPIIDPNSDTSGMDALSSMYTSPQDEERMRRASVANQRIMAVADALGNIYNTVNYAPAQQLNSPVLEEQARYERGKALRDKANLTYLNYQQAKAAQDAKARQWEADFNLKVADAARKAGYTEAQIKNMQDRLAQQKAYQDAQIDLGKRKADDAKALGEARLKQQTSYQNRMAGIAAGRLADQRRRTTAYVNRQSSGGGGGNRNSKPTSLRGTNGWYSKKMNSDESHAFYNQTYEEMKKRGLIKEDAVLAGLPADIYGNKSISNAAKKAAVDNALMEHPEVGDWLADEFEFDFDPRYRENGTPMKPSAETPFQAPWSNNRGNPFEDRQPKGNRENNHKSNPFG